MSAPVLVFLTNHFPFGAGEAFIEPELRIINHFFSRLLIITVSHNEIQTREISNEVHSIPKHASAQDYFSAVRICITNLPLVFKIIRQEKFPQGNIIRLFFNPFLHDLFKAFSYSARIVKILKHLGDEKKILYSYWLNNRALAALISAKLMKNTTVISRVHGGDLYTERHSGNFLPFRNFISTQVKALCFISEHGRNYFNEKYRPLNRSNQLVSRLGIKDFGLNPVPTENDELFVVSCSFLEPVKRIDILVKAIAGIRNKSIHWIHIGGGPLEKSIRDLAEQILTSAGIRYTMMGNLTPMDIRLFYTRQPVHVFVNTSSSEGIPVSVMEAISAGIPVIGSAVGGLAEIITNENGLLLPAGSGIEDFSDGIQKLILNPDYHSLRKGARRVWENSFNAEVNFPNFADILLKL